MKISAILIVLCAITGATEISETSSRTLEFKITNIQQKGGEVMIAIYNNESDWMDKPFQTTTLKTDKDSEVVSLELPHGTYALSVYQDVNGNGELDTNFMGIPKEPIAFGNNFKPFGKPKFEDASFQFDAEYQIQTLKLYTIL